MLLHVGIIGFQFDRGDLYGFTRNLSATKGSAFSSREEFANSTPGTRDLTTLAVNVHAIAEIIIDAEEIKLVTRFATGTSTKANRRNRQAAEEPHCHVQIMYVLFDDMVAGHLCEVNPIACHVISIGLASVTALNPGYHAIPLHNTAADSTDRTRVDECFIAQVFCGIAALGAGNNG